MVEPDIIHVFVGSGRGEMSSCSESAVVLIYLVDCCFLFLGFGVFSLADLSGLQYLMEGN